MLENATLEELEKLMTMPGTKVTSLNNADIKPGMLIMADAWRERWLFEVTEKTAEHFYAHVFTASAHGKGEYLGIRLIDGNIHLQKPIYQVTLKNARGQTGSIEKISILS